MTILEELLPKEEFEIFIQKHLFKHPYAAPNVAKNFINLISWTLLEEYFSSHNDCWLPKSGRLPLEPELCKGILTSVQAHWGFSNGNTILIRHAERGNPCLARIAEDFTRQFFGNPVDIQLYVTPKGNEGFDWHYDVEDVFVIQSQGEKEFRLLYNTITPRPLPQFSRETAHFHNEKTFPEIRCLLKEGDWLYIPAGVWHKARAITDSFHLSVGVLCQ